MGNEKQPSNIKQFRLNSFSIVHDIVFHGNGGFDYNTVYNFPLWLRTFTYNKIKQFNAPKDEDDDVVEQTRNNIKKADKTAGPPLPRKPDYISKSSKKPS